MKTPVLNIILLLCPILCIGQLINAPNKTFNGKKNGLWNELVYEDSLLTDGTYKLIFDLHYNPKYVLDEGEYKDNERTGIWKQYWIHPSIGKEPSEHTIYQKGQIRRIIEYENGVQSGLYLEFHRNGRLRFVGQYETYPHASVDTLPVFDEITQTVKDSVIYSNLSSRRYGKWYEFTADGDHIYVR